MTAPAHDKHGTFLESGKNFLFPFVSGLQGIYVEKHCFICSNAEQPRERLDELLIVSTVRYEHLASLVARHAAIVAELLWKQCCTISAMDILQTYETTIASPNAGLSATIFVIPARSFRMGQLDGEFKLQWVAQTLFEVTLERTAAYIEPYDFANVIGAQPLYSNVHDDLLEFSTYVANARVVPFESSPPGAESLSGIAAAAKAGAVGLGATIGYMAAGPTPFLLITVPLGIVLCGASISFAKWMEQNRNKIWNKLSGL